MRPFRLANIIFITALVLLDIAYLAGLVEWWWLLVLLLVYTGVLVMGAVFIQWNFYLHSYNKGNSREIAVTFDDGPASETSAILDILKQHQVQAAFFVIGKNAAQHPDVVKRCHNEGHIVGNHSYHHGFSFDWQSSKKMAAEIEQTIEVIANITGKRPKLFRPPYGVTNPNLARAVTMAGMCPVGWSLRSFDTKAKSPARLLNKLLHNLEGGDIVLLHDTMPVTRDILTEFIVRAKEKGFTFARIDKLLDLDAYA